MTIAAASTPRLVLPPRPFPEDPAIGARVRIRADDYGRDAIDGELAFIDADEIAIRHTDNRVGEVVEHFPRLGYDLRAVG